MRPSTTDQCDGGDRVAMKGGGASSPVSSKSTPHKPLLPTRQRQGATGGRMLLFGARQERECSFRDRLSNRRPSRSRQHCCASRLSFCRRSFARSESARQIRFTVRQSVSAVSHSSIFDRQCSKRPPGTKLNAPRSKQRRLFPALSLSLTTTQNASDSSSQRAKRPSNLQNIHSTLRAAQR